MTVGMTVGIVAFLLGLALIHMSVADSLESASKARNGTQTVEDLKLLPDGKIYLEGINNAISENFIRNSSALLQKIAMLMMNIEEDRYFDQCDKVGQHIICMRVFLLDFDGFVRYQSIALDVEEEFKSEDDIDGFNDVNKQAED